MTPEAFVDDIVWRVYTELTSSSVGRHIVSPYPAAGEEFVRWTDRETHFALEQRQPVDHESYLRVRREIMRAVATRAAELFSDWGGHGWPAQRGDARNLRASLNPYLPPDLRYAPLPPVAEPHPGLERRGDGTVTWTDGRTTMLARETPGAPLPELLLTDPGRAADLLFSRWDTLDEVAPAAPAVMPPLPAGARRVSITFANAAAAHNVCMPLMMASGSVAARNGNAVSASVSPESWPAIWEACSREGATAEGVSFA